MPVLLRSLRLRMTTHSNTASQGAGSLGRQILWAYHRSFKTTKNTCHRYGQFARSTPTLHQANPLFKTGNNAVETAARLLCGHHPPWPPLCKGGKGSRGELVCLASGITQRRRG